MRRHLLLLWVLAGGTAWAQNELEGLDLTDPPKKEEPKKEEPKKETSPPSSAKADAPPGPVKNTGPAVERDITQEDRVKSVQRKLYLKRFRFELAPYFLVGVNDPFFNKIGGALRAAFHFSDTLALSVRGSLFRLLSTDDKPVAQRVLSSVVHYSVPIWSVMGGFEWSPFYGKVSFMNTIVHLDGFVTAGAGVMYTEKTPSEGFRPAFDIGGGLRFVVRDWVAANAMLINTTYVDVPAGTNKAGTNNLLAAYVGLSIYIPFRSTFREAE